MKPKRRVFCRVANKLKILFETKEKAERFIKFNSGDMLNEKGYCPIRAYKCLVCGGWHVTSKEKSDLHQKNDSLINDLFGYEAEDTDKDYERKMKEIHDKAVSLIDKAKSYTESGLLSYAKEEIEKAAEYIASQTKFQDRDDVVEMAIRLTKIIESSISKSEYISIPLIEDVTLTKESVEDIYNRCHIKEEDSTNTDYIRVDVIGLSVYFDINILSECTHTIKCLINQLPHKLRETRRVHVGKYNSLRFSHGGEQWCESAVYSDMILTLGIAIGAICYFEYENTLIIKDKQNS